MSRPKESSAATCPKYGGKVCRPEAGALCECYPGKKPSAAFVARFTYWLVTGGDGDLPVALRIFWKVLTWGIVAILVYVMATTKGIDTLGLVVMSVLGAAFVLMALFTRLGWD